MELRPLPSGVDVLLAELRASRCLVVRLRVVCEVAGLFVGWVVWHRVGVAFGWEA